MQSLIKENAESPVAEKWGGLCSTLFFCYEKIGACLSRQQIHTRKGNRKSDVLGKSLALTGSGNFDDGDDAFVNVEYRWRIDAFCIKIEQWLNYQR